MGKLKELNDFVFERFQEADIMEEEEGISKEDKIHLKAKAFAYLDVLSQINKITERNEKSRKANEFILPIYSDEEAERLGKRKSLDFFNQMVDDITMLTEIVEKEGGGRSGDFIKVNVTAKYYSKNNIILEKGKNNE